MRLQKFRFISHLFVFKKQEDIFQITHKLQSNGVKANTVKNS